MHRPHKRDEENSKVEQMAELEEIRELAKCIMEYSNVRMNELEDPFERYAFQLKAQWHQDIKIFSRRLVRGYQVLIDQLRCKHSSE